MKMFKTITIIVLTLVLMFSILISVLTFALFGCGDMDDVRMLIARDVMWDSMEDETIEDTPEKKPNSTTVETPAVTEMYEETTAPETVENENKFDGVEPLCIWNMNGIEITVLGLEMDAFWGPTMYLEIENRSKDDILIGFNDVAVNGYMMDPFWATTVTAGNKSRETVTWLDASCVENNIEDIETVEGYFSISNDDTWDKIVDTPTIRVTFD